ncbi:MAG TPA: Crp/Fnr family transcriptional regulator [Patescibacteria group bacterium]|nr:Crp/Fnr family transcriptional regulator [Patescibacteria group bacterium]
MAKQKKPSYMIPFQNINLTVGEKIEILSKFNLFKNSNKAEIEAFARVTNPKNIRPMEIFVEEGFDDHRTYFVYKGVASLFRTTREGEIINIDVVGAPTIVGMSGLIDNKTSTTSTVAVGDLQTLVLYQRDFQELIPNYPNLALEMMKLFAEKIHKFDVFIEDVLSKNLHDRTWGLLQYLSHYFAHDEITLSHEQIADLVWGTRSRVTEVLNKLEEEGKIQMGHRKIKLT